MSSTKIAVLSLVIAYFHIWIPRLFVASAQSKMPEGYDNSHPRAQQAKLTGRGARAQGAHMNAIEAFPPFAAAMMVCLFTGARPGLVSALALAFVALRSVYIGLYLADLPSLRSTVWFFSMLITTTLLTMPLWS